MRFGELLVLKWIRALPADEADRLRSDIMRQHFQPGDRGDKVRARSGDRAKHTSQRNPTQSDIVAKPSSSPSVGREAECSLVALSNAPRRRQALRERLQEVRHTLRSGERLGDLYPDGQPIVWGRVDQSGANEERPKGEGGGSSYSARSPTPPRNAHPSPRDQWAHKTLSEGKGQRLLTDSRTVRVSRPECGWKSFGRIGDRLHALGRLPEVAVYLFMR